MTNSMPLSAFQKFRKNGWPATAFWAKFLRRALAGLRRVAHVNEKALGNFACNCCQLPFNCADQLLIEKLLINGASPLKFHHGSTAGHPSVPRPFFSPFSPKSMSIKFPKPAFHNAFLLNDLSKIDSSAK
jgi:hypothetical protein